MNSVLLPTTYRRSRAEQPGRLARTSRWGKPCHMPVLPPVKKFLSNLGVRIYQIPCQVFETLSARVYLLLGAGPPTLVDAGSSLKSSIRQILAGVETVRDEFGERVGLGDIRRITRSATATWTTSGACQNCCGRCRPRWPFMRWIAGPSPGPGSTAVGGRQPIERLPAPGGRGPGPPCRSAEDIAL